ncbi:MAG: hypothetical protein M1827_001077 [Pycnora praestabilis]|nr:MAG: hypothetical protein M1827_001077 [Pycnora praestabilis]
MSARSTLRLFQATSRRFGASSLKQPLGRRFAATDATAAAPGAPTQGTFARLWNSPIGVKTVHFWAPVMKWSIVLAGASDFTRPAENLSLTQNIALMCTGAIWTRWCFIIKPQNLMLAGVNALLFTVGATQVTRIVMYQRSLDNATVGEEAKKDAKEVADTAKGVVMNPESAAKKAVN